MSTSVQVKNPKSQKKESQWWNVSMGFARITSKELANSFCKKNDDKSAVALLKKEFLACQMWNLLSTVTKATIKRGNPLQNVTPVMS